MNKCGCATPCPKCGDYVGRYETHACPVSSRPQTSRKGWECPRCYIVHAPWVAACLCPSGVIPYGPVSREDSDRMTGKVKLCGCGPNGVCMRCAVEGEVIR